MRDFDIEEIKGKKFYYSILVLELRKKWVELAFLLTPRFMEKRIERLWSHISEYEQAIQYLKEVL